MLHKNVWFLFFLKKQAKRVQHALKESEFLRLKRARLTVDDFIPLKIIGKGAFGEVSLKKNLLMFG